MESSKKEIIIGILLGILIFSVGFLWVYNSVGTSSSNQNNKGTYQENHIKGKKFIKETAACEISDESDLIMSYMKQTSLRDLMHDVHEKLNSTVGWCRTPTVNDYNELSKLIDNIEKNMKDIAYIPLKNDFKELCDCLKNGCDNQNEDEIIKAHRIAHDLDCHFFNNTDKDIFGVTKTLNAIKY